MLVPQPLHLREFFAVLGLFPEPLGKDIGVLFPSVAHSATSIRRSYEASWVFLSGGKCKMQYLSSPFFFFFVLSFGAGVCYAPNHWTPAGPGVFIGFLSTLCSMYLTKASDVFSSCSSSLINMIPLICWTNMVSCRAPSVRTEGKELT